VRCAHRGGAQHVLGRRRWGPLLRGLPVRIVRTDHRSFYAHTYGNSHSKPNIYVNTHAYGHPKPNTHVNIHAHAHPKPNTYVDIHV
jgi:hypothetical protein